MTYANTNACKVLKSFVLKLKQVIFKKGEVSSPEKEEQKPKGRQNLRMKLRSKNVVRLRISMMLMAQEYI